MAVTRQNPTPRLPVEIIELIIRELVVLPIPPSEHDQIERTSTLVSHLWSTLFRTLQSAAFKDAYIASPVEAEFYAHRVMRTRPETWAGCAARERFGTPHTLTITLAPPNDWHPADAATASQRPPLPMADALHTLLDTLTNPPWALNRNRTPTHLILEFINAPCDVLETISFMVFISQITTHLEVRCLSRGYPYSCMDLDNDGPTPSPLATATHNLPLPKALVSSNYFERAPGGGVTARAVSTRAGERDTLRRESAVSHIRLSYKELKATPVYGI
ncbi:hypothetical protein R3P38DRAFT_2792051 [Favolaschia claudopus]|uniref:F-box domain-containing protein n=1 Tax=Favolaschia claudopus TaxID=2862362 RepID=A0AAW0AFS7_9AGAR